MGKVKVKRTQLSINDMQDILCDLEANVGRAEICKKYKIINSTISKLIKNRAAIEERFQSQPGTSKRARLSQFPTLDKALLEWFNIQRSRNVPLNGPILIEKATQFAEKLNIKLKGDQVSDGFLSKFKKRHGIQFRVISGEAGAVDTTVVEDWIKNKWSKYREGYNDEDIFNADECGLFYKMLPNKTFEYKGKRCTGGKMAKQRITVLVCSNATGSVKVKPLVIGKYQNPRCFKGIRKNNLPVAYTANSKAWMTSELFTQHIVKWNKGLRSAGRKILLLLDNCPAHPQSIPNLTNIKLVFLPPNVTSVIQPMDAGVIKNLKHHYRKILLRKYICALDSNQELDINIKDAIMIVAQAWKLVTTDTIKNCFRKARISDGVTVTGEDEIIVVDEDLDIDLELPQGVTMADYVEADDDLECYETPTDDDIVESLTESTLAAPESDEEPLEEENISVSYIDAIRSIANLRDYILSNLSSSDTAENLCLALSDMEINISKAKLSTMKQNSILNYFKPIPDTK